MFSHGLLHMDTPVEAEQQELTSSLWEHEVPCKRLTKGDGW